MFDGGIVGQRNTGRDLGDLISSSNDVTKAPRIVEVGSTLGLTLGEGIAGSDDYGLFIGKYGQEIGVSYGTNLS